LQKKGFKTILIFNYKIFLIMKNFRFNFLTFAAIIFGMLLLSAGICDPDPEPDTLSVSGSRYTFNADDTKEEVVTVTTNVDSWSAKESASWVILEKNSYELRISVQNYNESGDSRQAEITVTAGTADPVTIRITQSARDNLSISPESLTFESNETGSKTVSITTNASGWDAKTDASWLTTGKDGNTLRVTVTSENTGSSPRSAAITVTAGNSFEKTLTVTQKERSTLSISPSSLAFDEKVGAKTVTVNTNASSWDATTNASWIQLGKQGSTLTVSVTANTGSSARSATVTVTAGNAPPVAFSVTQEAGLVTYRNVTASYRCGGTVSLRFYNYDSDDGLIIVGYVTTPSSFNNLKLDAGTYSCSSSGAVRTFYPGYPGDPVNGRITSVYGTIIFNFNTQEFIPITGGTFTVAVSGSNYTITTSFSGRDHKTGAILDNFRAQYSGTISFINNCDDPSIPFPSSNFVATGTPLNPNSPTSWTGTITPTPSTGTANYYTISKWGTFTDKVYLDYKNSKLMMDNTTKAFELDGENYYFKAVALNVSAGTGTVLSSYEAKYNSSTNTLDFSGYSGGYPVYVGYVAQYGTTISMIHVYSNAKFTLTRMSSAPQLPFNGISEKSSSNASKTDGSGKILLKTDAPPVVTFKKAPLPNK
jgi:hypothetical protein